MRKLAEWTSWTVLAIAVLSLGFVMLASRQGWEFDAVLSVQDVGVFKPSGKVYQLVETVLGAKPNEVIFVSSNGWDASCATSFGFETVWVNRTGLPMDRLSGKPKHILSDLKELPELVAERNNA